MSKAYYNEFEPAKAAWLRELIAQGLIAPGDVDERSILDVHPGDLRGYTQCHFFAGIGIWSHALRSAGWADHEPVWTGSCPCQPFSAAGKGAGFTDERHLWPAWHHLIRECRPRFIFGEQVASKDGLAWLDLVQADLEAESYANGALDLCAAGFGAPHIRQRLWIVAYSTRERGQRLPEGSQRVREPHATGHLEAGHLAHADNPKRRPSVARGHEPHGSKAGWQQSHGEPGEHSAPGLVANPVQNGAGQHARELPSDESQYALWPSHGDNSPEPGRPTGELGNADGERSLSSSHARIHSQEESAGPWDGQPKRPGPVNGFWADAEWLPCIDGKARAVRPGSFPLAHGAPARVVRLRGYGDGIVAQAATEVVRAAREVLHVIRQ